MRPWNRKKQEIPQESGIFQTLEEFLGAHQYREISVKIPGRRPWAHVSLSDIDDFICSAGMILNSRKMGLADDFTWTSLAKLTWPTESSQADFIKICLQKACRIDSVKPIERLREKARECFTGDNFVALTTDFEEHLILCSGEWWYLKNHRQYDMPTYDVWLVENMDIYEFEEALLDSDRTKPMETLIPMLYAGSTGMPGMPSGTGFRSSYPMILSEMAKTAQHLRMLCQLSNKSPYWATNQIIEQCFMY